MNKESSIGENMGHGVKWNSVTWYSWALAIIVFLLLIPGMAFYMGTQYQRTQDETAELEETHGVTITPEGVATPTSPVVKKHIPPAPKIIACTMEAKMCVGGSSVGREGPLCEFAKCPSITGRPTLHGSVFISPVCPVERIPPDPACAPSAYDGSLEIWDPRGGFVKSFRVAAKGIFETELTPGSYMLKLPSATVLPRLSAPVSFLIESGKVTELSLTLDSGIR